MDQDSDGFISSDDLRVMLQNLGMRSEPKDVARYMDGMGGQDNRGRQGVNFTQFLTMFGELLSDVSVCCDSSNSEGNSDTHPIGVVNIGTDSILSIPRPGTDGRRSNALRSICVL